MPSEERKALPIGQILPTIGSFIYVYWWVKRANWRHWADKTAIVALAFGLVVLGVEVVMELWGYRVVGHHYWIQALFFCGIAVLLYSKFREFGGRRQQASFIDAARQVTQKLSRPQGEDHEDQIVMKLVGLFQVTFQRKGWTWFGRRPNNVRVNAAILNKATGQLKVCYEHPPDQGDHGPAFDVGTGGAGYCFAKDSLVYIPRKKLRHGIVQAIDEDPGDEPFAMEPDVYLPQGSRDYQSILSVPIRAHGERFGVLNFDSPRVNAFRRIDFEQATFFGFALALVLLHNQGAGGAMQAGSRPLSP
jgi:hypothetical protein